MANGDFEGGGARAPVPRGGSDLPRSVVYVVGGIMALVVVSVVAMFATGRLGVVTITDREVAVKVNYLSGGRELITTPGIKLYMPFVHEIFPFDRSPQKFLMEGSQYVDQNHVPLLTVRAKDGSNFSFGTLEIQYQIIPASASLVLDDSGPDDGFKSDWIKAYARSVLRDEFGRYSAVEVADPSSYQAARVESERRLNELLEPHGIEVIQIVNPKPKFDPSYEKTIEDRKVADQAVEALKVQRDQLLQQRDRFLAKVEKEKQIEQESLRGELARALKEAERSSIQVTRSADAYAAERVLNGEGEQARMTFTAQGLEAEYRSEAEGLTAKAKALEQHGDVLVRSALIEKLKSVTFTLVPYSRDPTPQRLEHSETGRAERVPEGDGGER